MNPRLFFLFLALATGSVAAQEKPAAPVVIGAEAPKEGVKYPIDQHPDFIAMKARAEKAELLAEYWKVSSERNELAIRLLQTQAQLAEAGKGEPAKKP